MYLYKYLFKGLDTTLFRIQQHQDGHINEISDYVDACYLSTFESGWQILALELTSMSPSVDCLSVHLPDHNIAQFYQRNTAVSTTSDLLHYFLHPQLPQFDNLLYYEYFEDYVLYKWCPEVPLQPDEYLECYEEGRIRKRIRK